MASFVIAKKYQKALLTFLKKRRKPELLMTYLFFLGKKYDISPVVFPKKKMIYQSLDNAIKLLEQDGEIWRETKIKISFDASSVNEETTRIYICPFTGKVFGNNTHPNPQDAIYDWVAKCPENKDRDKGIKVKRFFVSEDPEVIKNYIKKRKKPIDKIVFSSVLNGKLFNSKYDVIEDARKNYFKSMTLIEVQNQNRFEIEDHFLHFLQEHVDEKKITSFVASLSKDEEFVPLITHWFDEEGDS